MAARGNSKRRNEKNIYIVISHPQTHRKPSCPWLTAADVHRLGDTSGAAHQHHVVHALLVNATVLAKKKMAGGAMINGDLMGFNGF